MCFGTSGRFGTRWCLRGTERDGPGREGGESPSQSLVVRKMLFRIRFPRQGKHMARIKKSFRILVRVIDWFIVIIVAFIFRELVGMAIQ